MHPELKVVGEELWKRIGESMDRVELRLRKVVSILESTSIPFAVVGGNAVRVWVAQVDPGAVRATNDVDILIRPEDLEHLKLIMAENGYLYRKAAGLDMFLEGKEDSVRYAIHIVLANRMVKQDDFEANPDVEPTEYGDGIRILPLERLVRMKLNSFRLKDRVHVLDMIDVGLVDESWIARFPKPIAERLKSLIDNPDQ
ncbi:MAG: hypothetical protein LW850_18535 [Planctomycetaceae bacterium]|jgi:hypothetical protein|nr:hypothetical protein [Planctomycetaceae bacterium]